MAAKDPFKGAWCGKDAPIGLVTDKRVRESDMIGVVVSKNNAAYGVRVYSVAVQLGEYKFVVDTGIDEQAAIPCADIGTIPAASGAERDEAEATVGGAKFFRKCERVGL